MLSLEEIIGYRFRDRSILNRALTHSSYLNEHGLDKTECNERLEFLGDAILEAISSEFLYKTFPDKQEGYLSKLRSQLVCEEALSVSASEISLGEFLRLGKGASQDGGRENAAITSDAFEALIAALYLDGGPETAKELIYKHVLSNPLDRISFIDSKTSLQEFVQAENSKNRIEYRLLKEEGPDHQKSFVFGVYLNGILFSEGKGHSKKNAQQNAASAAMTKLRNNATCI